MKSNVSLQVKKLVFTSLFAAIIFVTTYYHLPIGLNGGYIHIGDAFIYLAACIMPGPYAMAAGAIGAGLSDALSPGAFVWVIPTIIIKPLLTLYFTRKPEKFICKRNIIAIFLAGITGLIGYFIAGSIISGNIIATLAFSLLDSIQPIASGILFVIIGIAFDKRKMKKIFKKVF
jgi:uncharacterized repeat protein (TIGR04002 family)